MRTRTLAQVVVVGMLLALVSGGTVAQGAPQPGVVHFTAAGDFGSNARTDTVLAGMNAADPDLSLALGDLSYAATGTEQAWCDKVTSQLGAGFPFELIAGNHESNGQNGNINDFSACLPNQLPGLVGTYGRQWYVDVPQIDPIVRFVMVSPALQFPDSTWSYAAGSPRYTWTEAAIDGARANNIPWVVVGAHKPCFSMGNYTCEIGSDFTNMLISKRVDLVLHGHEHLYQRSHQLGTRAGCTTVTPDAYNAACRADTDATMNQGAGTVFVTSGLSGQERRDVNTADTEAGYFASYSGGNLNPTDGFFDVSATDDALTARFVPVAGGTFTDSFVINRGTPPPNTPPTAAFTSSTSNLTATFDGRGSTDTEGPIASYSWDFGDSMPPGSGAQPSHTYAAADTYNVTLTVTDSAGATDTETQPVTVTDPPPGPVDFVVDNFGRTVSNGLGTADAGGAWSLSGTAANFAVDGSAGAITSPSAGQIRSGWLGATTRSDTDLRMTLALDKVPTGNGLYLDVIGRRVSLNNEYRARLVMAANGRITVQLTALKGTGNPVAIATAVTLPTSITYSAGSQVNVRMQVTGTNATTVRLKVWPASVTEPAAWQTTATDTYAALQTPGAVGIATCLSGSATNAPVVVRMDALSARPAA
ncbi:PKD domain-containing protein [Blastococcus sp. CT_GayMR16]|uniref:PKD domain-containing protein n=1 Tax=Blastococcus sp. CT_GayMR16 TaxID=2559607 RepID=UPI001073C058|nr:PKD domain-containing protein [Blastococcus sp. CT_GayMR16]TFV90675.1 PKD domain-containing protein [Blastococcus sp. CT_GayMR16]